MRRIRSQFLQSVFGPPLAVRSRVASGETADARSFQGTGDLLKSRQARSGGLVLMSILLKPLTGFSQPAPGAPFASGARTPFRLLLVALAALGAVLCLLPAIASADACPNAAIRAQQGATYLPDCMAFEQATPPHKNGFDAAFSIGVSSVEPTLSANGDRLLFVSRAALEDGPVGPFGGSFVASRGDEGWRTTSTAASPETRVLGTGPFAFTPDLGRMFEFQSARSQFLLGYFGGYEKQLTEDGSSTAWLSRSPLMRAVNVPSSPSNVPDTKESFLGASSDLSHVLFNAQSLTPALIAGDPTPAPLGLAAPNTYVLAEDAAGSQSLSLLARDDQTGTAWGEACGAWPGGGEIGGGRGGRGQGAISPTGDRIYFSTRPASVGHPNTAACDSSNQIRILLRTEQPSGDAAITPVTPVEPPSGNDYFEGASADGTRVYFTTTRALDAADADAVAPGADCSKAAAIEGCDLYLYDSSLPVGERFVQVSAGDASSPSPGVGAQVIRGLTAISGDGSHVYFVAAGVLTTELSPTGTTAVAGQNNLYLYQRDQQFPDGHYAFLGDVSDADGGALFGGGISYMSAEAVPLIGKTQTDGGDGHVLVFTTHAALTSNDGDGARVDAYRYDAAAAIAGDPSGLRCISCQSPGIDGEPFDVAMPVGSPIPRYSQYPVSGRWSSEDGNVVLFSTDEPLTPDDEDGAVNLYLWHADGNGQRLIRLPATESFFDRPKGGVSHDGSEVAFETAQPLVSQDGDTAVDVYVARVDGGFPEPAPPAPCDVLADGCQGGGFAPSSTDRKTTSPSGSDNGPSEARKTLSFSSPSKKARRKASRSGRLALMVRASRAGLVRVQARAKLGKKARRVGHASKRVKAGTSTRFNLRLNSRARKRLRSGEALKVTLRVAAPGARTRTRSVLLPGVRS